MTTCAHPKCDIELGDTRNRNQRYCSAAHRKTGYKRRISSVHDVEFIGIDGEGIGRGSEHKYVLLGCGDNQITNASGIHWEEALSFLYSCFEEKPAAAYVGYFLGYDFAQILKSLPQERAWRLLHPRGVATRRRKASGGNPIPFPVRVRGDIEWEMDMLPGRRLKFRPAHKTKWMYVCDAGPFFQCSFLKAIDPKGWNEPIISEQEFELIRKGKERRDVAVLDADMRRYMALEIDVLARLMAVLNRGFVSAGVLLRKDQWFGPGQAAQEWLKLQNAPRRVVIEKITPKSVRAYADRAYYGGWFEITMHGHIPGITYEYDINSAYPTVIASLPCLLHGKWKWAAGKPPKGSKYALVRAVVTGDNPYLGTMLHRSSVGNILRPYKTEGIYWQHELDAARKAGLIKSVKYKRSFYYTPCPCPPPFSALADLYQKRLDIGKNTPAGKAYKLLYNSAYGKFAQTVGDPIFANSIYAGLITAGCRTQILEAIATHPKGAKDVAMVATDGVYFLSPHPKLPISERLGDWDIAEKSNLCLFKPGVYWDDAARDSIRKGDPAKFKARGVSAKAFSVRIADIDRAFSEWDKSQGLGQLIFPEVSFPIAFSVISLNQALAWNKWEVAGEVRENVTVNQHSWPDEKRSVKDCGFDKEAGVWRSRPKPAGNAWWGLDPKVTLMSYGARNVLDEELHIDEWDGLVPVDDPSIVEPWAEAMGIG